MALAYQPPGTTVTEVVSPQVSPLLSTPASICLVGPSQGYQTRTDQFTFNGTAAIPLPGLPAGATLLSVISVKDALDPSKGAADGSGYTVTTDYTVSAGAGTVTRVGAGGIADGSLVNITYQFVVSDYFQPVRLNDFASVESRFGPALNSTASAVNSALSYAASIAFENGAGSLVLQPLFARATPGDPTSTATQATGAAVAASTSWSDTLYGLRGIEDINVLVPIIGQSVANVNDGAMLAIEQVVQDHLSFMATQEQYIEAIVAEDASASNTVATAATVRSHAATLRSRYGGVLAEQIVFLSVTAATRPLPANNASIKLGGQFVAAGVAGMLASQPVSAALTRQVVSGFSTISSPSPYNLQDKNTDAAAGLFVIEQRGQLVQVRHAITLDNTSSARRELSVVRAKHRMIESVRDTMESQIIGKIIADGNAPYIVRSSVVGVLEGLRQAKDLVDYSAVDAQLASLDPTTINVRFSYRPAFTLNYVNITFSLDLTNATVTAVGDGVNT